MSINSVSFDNLQALNKVAKASLMEGLHNLNLESVNRRCLQSYLPHISSAMI